MILLFLDAGLPGVLYYEHKGYRNNWPRTIIELENNVKLVYEIMEKSLKRQMNILKIVATYVNAQLLAMLQN